MRAPALAVRFVLELAALVVFAVGALTLTDGVVSGLAVGVGAPLAAAVLWGAFVAPKAWIDAPTWLRTLVELAFWGAAVASLAATGPAALAVAFAVVVALDVALVRPWEQWRRLPTRARA